LGCKFRPGTTGAVQKESGFKLYSDVSRGTLFQQDLLVVQYESLHRLFDSGGKFKPYDLLLIDKYRAICSQIISETNKMHLPENFKAFKMLHNTSKYSLLLDAFMFHDHLCRQFID
jgi:hypothetical protein